MPYLRYLLCLNNPFVLTLFSAMPGDYILLLVLKKSEP